MKQTLIVAFLVVFIPFFIITFCMKEEQTKTWTGEFVSKTTVRVKRNKTGNIDVVPLEEYVLGVVAGEMPVSFHIEALKAQAVAARTYVLKRVSYNKKKEYDVVDTVLNQVYLDENTLKSRWKDNYETYYKKLYKAVKETESEYLEYDGKVIDAMFFSTSNGYTENSGEIFSTNLPYLKSVKSEWDSETSPVFEDYETFTLKEFYRLLNLPYQDKLNINITQKTSTGRCVSLTINGQKMSASSFYQKLGLRSTDFDISRNNDTIYIKTKGYGHGVGMSQYGAYAMAKKGYTYEQILTYYYQDVDLKKLK